MRPLVLMIALAATLAHPAAAEDAPFGRACAAERRVIDLRIIENGAAHNLVQTYRRLTP